MKKESENNTQLAYKSISRAAQILSCLSEGKNSVTEIAQNCELNKSTVSRLLAALDKSNLAVRDPLHRKYFLGYLLNRLVANPNTTHLNLITLSVGEMSNLSRLCGETVVLDILVGIKNVRLHMIPSIHPIRVYDDNYDSTTLNVHGAAIKTLLSQLDKRELALVTNYIKFGDTVANSLFEKKKILSQLDLIREQGYAISRSERISGAVAISAAIRGYHLPAAITVLGVEPRLEPRISEMLPEVVRSANRISLNLKK
ncbi:MAG TPA: IclR family transcriptional regulator [Dehalococcoidales bacterium]|nr:IclR family transcriptional regulator [Dehalococcoidales bacterium]